MLRYNIYDLQAPQSKEHQDTLIVKQDIIVPDSLLLKLKLTRAAIYAISSQEVNLLEKRIQLKPYFDSQDSIIKQEINIEENINHLKQHTKIKKYFIKKNHSPSFSYFFTIRKNQKNADCIN